MGVFARNVSMAILLALFLTISIRAASANAKVRVNISIDMIEEGGASVSINVHCKTRRHDYGGQVISHGLFFIYEFSPSIIFRDTQMDCDIEWNGRTRRIGAYRRQMVDLYCKPGIGKWSISRNEACAFNYIENEFDCQAWHVESSIF